MYFSLFTSLTFLTSLVSAYPGASHHPSSIPSLSKIYQFSNTTWIENLAPRPNGELLITLTSTPDLYNINPSTHAATLIHSFPSATGLLGITELSHDIYAVIAVDVSLATVTASPGTAALWKVDMTIRPSPTVSLIAHMPEILFPNGIDVLDAAAGTVLIAESAKGAIWELNTHTGAQSIFLSDPETTTPAPGAEVNLGVNGIRVDKKKEFVHFTSSTRGLFARFPLSHDLRPTGTVQVIASNVAPFLDDFTLAEDGPDCASNPKDQVLAYIATNLGNTVVSVSQSGEVKSVAGSIDSLDVAGCTAVAFGKGKERDVLYVSTGGATAAPVNGTVTEPGKVVALTFA